MRSYHPSCAVLLAMGLCAVLMLAGCATSNAASSPEAVAASGGGTIAVSSPTPAGTDPAATGTACSLVTEAEVTTALGSDPGVGAEVVDGSASSCTFGDYSTAYLSVNLVGVRGKAAFDKTKSGDTSGAMFDIPALGDSAFGSTHGPAASIWFTHGDAMVVIVLVVLSADGASDSKSALEVATLANGRLR